MNIIQTHCFFCGSSKPETLVLPEKEQIEDKHQFVDYEPCEKCKEQMDNNYLFLEITKTPNHNKELFKDVYPTGRWFCVKPEYIDQVIKNKELYENNRQFMIDEETYDKMFMNMVNEDKNDTKN